MGYDRQQLLKALLGRIDAARMGPEARLPGERELAQAFGASRSSVREALGVLEALRVIERRPQSGIYVRSAVSEPSVEAFVLQEALDVRSSTAEYEQAQEARIAAAAREDALVLDEHGIVASVCEPEVDAELLGAQHDLALRELAQGRVDPQHG